jgi:hypothetical protein
MNTRRYHIVRTMCGFHLLPKHHGDLGGGQRWTCWLWWSWRPIDDRDLEGD